MSFNLDNFVRVKNPENIPIGIWVRYVSRIDNKIRYGGICTVNTASQKFLMLKNPALGANMWSVQYDTNKFYINKEKAKEILIKNKLFELYKQNKLKII